MNTITNKRISASSVFCEHIFWAEVSPLMQVESIKLKNKEHSALKRQGNLVWKQVLAQTDNVLQIYAHDRA